MLYGFIAMCYYVIMTLGTGPHSIAFFSGLSQLPLIWGIVGINLVVIILCCVVLFSFQQLCRFSHFWVEICDVDAFETSNVSFMTFASIVFDCVFSLFWIFTPTNNYIAFISTCVMFALVHTVYDNAKRLVHIALDNIPELPEDNSNDIE